MTDDIRQELEQDYQMAKKGREIWLHFKEKYCMDTEWYLVICPTDNKQLNDCAIKNLHNFLKRKYKNKGLILSTKYIRFDDGMEKEGLFEIINEVLAIEDVNFLLKYYRLLPFFPNIVVISDEAPFGNLNIVGKKGITMDDYVNHALFV